MIGQLVRKAEKGDSVFISDLRDHIASLPDSLDIRCILLLADGRSKRHFTVHLPPVSSLDVSERAFVQSYIEAELYNTLTTLGGARLEIYIDPDNPDARKLIERTVESFDIEKPRSNRTGYGRAINVIDRMLTALGSVSNTTLPDKFEIEILSSAVYPGDTGDLSLQSKPSNVFKSVAENLAGKTICGLDIGGTDIKAALAVDGNIVALKEYDWNPAVYGNAEEIIDPIVDIAALMRIKASLLIDKTMDAEARVALDQKVKFALAKNSGHEDIRAAVKMAEDLLGTDLQFYHAIGLCFPDVVVRNKIVGGEVPKTVGMRKNSSRDFEDQFSLLTNLDGRLRTLCNPDGVVMNTNDGPMAAFTAAVELAASPGATPEIRQGASGVFAHTLGTDLGTGLVLGDGTIPEIPLEVYNLIVDLGNFPSRRYPSRDVRSLNNTNTGLPGTLQRFTSQTGAFRLAFERLESARPEAFAELLSRGFIRKEPDAHGEMWYVPEAPDDMRKPFLAHLMDLALADDEVAGIFRRIGEYIAVVWQESEHILKTGIEKRFLFGRLVKVQRCFELMQEGAAERAPRLELIAADSEMACTPLMKQLAASDEYTVAQFGQAVGAIYFGNLGISPS